MLQNEHDIKLLRENPRKLLLEYQPVIRVIVKSLAYQGYLPRRDMPDLVQEVNRKLVERLPRICERYNYKCRFRTYFSVVIRNLCLEEFRKARVITEPQPDIFEQTEPDSITDRLLFGEELERLRRAIRLFGRDEPAIWLTLRVLADASIRPEELGRFEKDPGPAVRKQLIRILDGARRKKRKEKLAILSEALARLDTRNRTPDAIRKWFTSRIEEIIRLMNGNPPRSAYTLDTLLILIEKTENEKNNA